MTNRLKWICGVWAASSLVASACSCGGTSIDDFPARAAKAYCTQVFSCCSAAEVADAGILGTDKASCEASVTSQLAGQNSLVKVDQEKGRARWRPDVAEACIARLSALTCAELKVSNTANPVECKTYVEPKVSSGGACRISSSCIVGACESTGAGDGVCTAYISEGQSCDAGSCTPGTYCDGRRTCTRLKVDGTACNGGFECSTGGCNRLDGGPGSGVCGVIGGPGTTCFVSSGCSMSGSPAAALVAVAMGAWFALRRPRRRR